MPLEISKVKYTLDELYSKIIDDALMLKIAHKMKEANDTNTDRTIFLQSLLAKDTGTLFPLWKKHKATIDAGKYNITRGAFTFEHNDGFAYGACAFVSKEARRGGFVIKMPTKNKSNKKDKEKLKALFSSIEGLERVSTSASNASQGQRDGQMDIMESMNK